MAFGTRILSVLVTLASSYPTVNSTSSSSFRDRLLRVNDHGLKAESLPIPTGSELLSATEIVKMLLLMPPTNTKLNLRLHILYDHQNEESAESMTLHFSGRFSGIMIYQFNGTLKQVEEMLTTSNVGTVTLLVTLCTPSNILHIFKMVDKGRLRSDFVQWLILGETNLDDELMLRLESLIFEGTRVSLIAREIPIGGFTLFSTELTEKGLIRFFSVGQWRNGDAVGDIFFLLMTSDDQYLYDDMRGRVMRVTALEYWSCIEYSEPKEDGSVEPDKGVDVNVLNTLSQQLNFTYKIYPPEDEQWGNSYPDGSVTGMIGVAANREAHFAVGCFAITEARERVIDFTFPYIEEGISIFSRAPKQKNRVFAVISPFSLQVWIYICLFILVMGPVLFVISNLMQNEQEKLNSLRDLQVYSFNMFRSVVIQGNLLESDYWPHRFTVFFWYLFCLNVSALYSGMLTAVLAIPSYETPVDYLTDLPKAVEEDGFILTVVGGTYLQYAFQDAKDGIYKTVWNLFNHEEPSESFIEDDMTGVKRILDGKYIYIGPKTEARVIATGFGKHRFHYGLDSFLGVYVGLPFPAGAPYLQSVNNWMMTMVESGLVAKWNQDETTVPQNFTLGNEPTSRTSPFSLSHLQAAFLLILLGFSSAALVLLVEAITTSINIFSRKRDY